MSRMIFEMNRFMTPSQSSLSKRCERRSNLSNHYNEFQIKKNCSFLESKKESRFFAMSSLGQPSVAQPLYRLFGGFQVGPVQFAVKADGQ